MKTGFLSTNLFLNKLESRLSKFRSKFSWVIITRVAFFFLLSGTCIKFLIEILFLEKIFVMEDKTPD